MVTVKRGERGLSAYHLLALPCERKAVEWHLPLFSAGVLAVTLLQQVIRWSVEGQALMLFLKAIPRAGRTADSDDHLKPLASVYLPPPKLLTFL